jgi:hypothetical protein
MNIVPKKLYTHPLKINKSMPSLGNYVHVNFLTDGGAPMHFTGVCVDTRFKHKGTSFTVVNAQGFKQMFLFFSPNILAVEVHSVKK